MRVVYSIGSNLGDRLAHLRAAVSGLSGDDLRLVGVSPVYSTKPWGVGGHPDYLNVVAVYQAGDAADPYALLRRGLGLENLAGRVRPADGTVAPRPLDVDLVVVGDLTLQTPDLTLPHPRAHLRGFVLVPWAAVDGAAVLPGRGSVSGLAASVGSEGLTIRTDLSAAP